MGGLVGRHPWVTLTVWLLLAVGAFSLSSGLLGTHSLFDRLTSGEPTVSGDAQRAGDLLDDTSDSGPSLTALLEEVDPTDADLADLVADARADLVAMDGVQAVVDPFAFPAEDPRRATYTSTDGDAVAVITLLEEGAPAGTAEPAVQRLRELVEEVEAEMQGAAGEVGGEEQLLEAITGQVEEDLRSGELIALPLSLLVMVFVFGGFLAAGIPVVGAIASIAGALASLLGFSYLLDVDSSVVSILTVLGLGLSIDYGLLMVSRYREEVRRPATQLPPPPEGTPQHSARADRIQALRRTMSTAGRTVMFSGVTVALSLSGLLLFEASILRAVGAAGLSVVVVALLVALTLIPACLAASGSALLTPGLLPRVPGLRTFTRKLGDVPPPEGFFSALARWTQRRPWLVTVAVTAVLVTLALPAAGMQLRGSGIELLPERDEQRQLFETLDEEFPALAGADVTVVALTADPDEAAEVAEQVAALDGVEDQRPPEVRDDRLTVLGFDLEGGPVGSDADDVVADIRALDTDVETLVTGQAAGLADFTDALLRDAPLAVTVVVAATFVLLFLMTGSLLVPAKALLLNVLSLGASFGVLVLVFQEGYGEELLDFSSTGGIEVFIPPLVLALGFGLAMDYEVFLLSRVKEFRDGGLANDAAVVAGLQRSGRIITSAALIIIIVFSGFVTGDLLIIKQTGVALAVAIAIDATLVRVLLVPATMTLLGEWNWWAPAPLRRLHARFGLSE